MSLGYKAIMEESDYLLGEIHHPIVITCQHMKSKMLYSK